MKILQVPSKLKLGAVSPEGFCFPRIKITKRGFSTFGSFGGKRSPWLVFIPFHPSQNISLSLDETYNTISHFAWWNSTKLWTQLYKIAFQIGTLKQIYNEQFKFKYQNNTYQTNRIPTPNHIVRTNSLREAFLQLILNMNLKFF